MTLASVQFFADPCCPWTWNTSRWLAEATEANGVAITWRTLSLAELNKDREVSEHLRPRLTCSRRMARVLEALRAEGRNDEIGAMFTAYGERVHLEQHDPGDSLIHACARDCAIDLAFTAAAIEDETWDHAITESVTEAMQLAGPDVGSPIIAIPERSLGFFGPIVSPPPTGRDALALWDVVVASFELPTFFELKRGRRDPVAFGPRP
jgi:hypothetical protein